MKQTSSVARDLSALLRSPLPGHHPFSMLEPQARSAAKWRAYPMNKNFIPHWKRARVVAAALDMTRRVHRGCTRGCLCQVLAGFLELHFLAEVAPFDAGGEVEMWPPPTPNNAAWSTIGFRPRLELAFLCPVFLRLKHFSKILQGSLLVQYPAIRL